MARRQHRMYVARVEPLWRRILFILYFAFYFVPIGFPLMCITAPIWVLGIIAKTPPLWNLSDVPRGFFIAPLLPFTWLARFYRDILLNRYKLYRDERRIRRIEPVPLPAKRPRRLSEGRIVGQTAPFFTKLPLEIRQIIYEDVIKCGSLHRHVLELRWCLDARKKHSQRRYRKKRVWGLGCEAGLTSHCTMGNSLYLPPCTPCSPVSLALGPDIPIENNLGGPLALAKTCRQIYRETIDMYYDRQTFCFPKLERPPHFIRGTLPQRLSKIRDIHLHFHPERSGPFCQPTVRHIRKCPACNFCGWLDLIKDSMTGLRTVEMTITVPQLEHPARYPTMKNAWVVRLLAFQHATKAKINFRAVAPDANDMEDEDRQPIKDFESQLKIELARARESNDAVIDIPEK